MNCKICQTPAKFTFCGKILNKYDVDYFECPHCGYLQTEEPYWLNEAYASPINSSDTGIIERNKINTRIVISTLFLLKKLNEKVVDYAGGYGVLVRMLRDVGVDAYWIDKYCDNLFARGFEFNSDGGVGMVAAFEVMEHFINPVDEIEKLFSISPNLLLSTVLLPSPTPAENDWWYYGINHGQHIGFFRVKTLQYLANKFNKKLLTNGISYHLFYDGKSIPYWNWRVVNILTKHLPMHRFYKLKSKILEDNEFMSKK